MINGPDVRRVENRIGKTLSKTGGSIADQFWRKSNGSRRVQNRVVALGEVIDEIDENTKLLEELDFAQRFSIWWPPLQADQHGFEERLDGVAGLKGGLKILEAAGFKGRLEGEFREKNRQQGEDDEGDE